MEIPGVVAISTCRGCVIEGDNYSGFNACHYTGDSEHHIKDCRERLCQLLDITPERLIIPRQTHSLNVAVIGSIPVATQLIDDIDAIVTTLSDVAIAVNTADCVPIALYDPSTGIKGVVHSGWKGTVGRIVERAVMKMIECGAQPHKITASMGPCICGDCFEVGDEVVEQFKINGFDNPQVILRGYGAKAHIDLPQACRQSLIKMGLTGQNIFMPQYCSRCNPTEFFSARRLGINSGRTLTLVL